MTLDRYVTNGKPILIVATFAGDILVYWLTIDPAYEAMSEKQKLEYHAEPKLLKKFNFFDKNLPRAKIGDNDSVDRRSRGVSFISQRLYLGNSFHQPREMLINELDRHTNSSSQKSDLDNKGPVETPTGLFVDTANMIQDDYWDLMMCTREKREGPDGIYLWNAVNKMVKDKNHTKIIVSALLEHGIDWSKNLDNVINNWFMCLRINCDRLPDAIDSFHF